MDSSQIEKELAIRKRLDKIFKKKREDFATEEAYNEYLELFEDLVYNLSEGINVEETKAIIENLRKENKETSEVDEELENVTAGLPVSSEAQEEEEVSIIFVDPIRPARPMPAPMKEENIDSVRQKAAGFDMELCRQRAKEELLSSLFFRQKELGIV
eukprot:jgi/Galph1/3426/GphlegSOOS_G2119.1